MSLVIGLCGAKGSGKDHFYHTVKKLYPNKNINKVAYADPIKHKIMHIFNLQSEAEYDTFKRRDVQYSLGNRVVEQDGRHIVREIGMMMREYDPDQFVNYVEQKIFDSITEDPSAIWCITDLRFQNELESIIYPLDGQVVKIKRVGYEYDGHITEKEFCDEQCDIILKNDTNNIEDYEANIRQVFEKLINEENQ
jgi:hypothetical protein